MSHVKGPDISGITSVPDGSFSQTFLERIEKYGDDVAVTEAESGEKVSYSELLQNCKSVSAELCSRGVGEGDLVVLCCDQSILSYTLLLGAIFSGTTVALIPIPNADIIHKLINGQLVKAVFYEPKYTRKVHESLQHLEPRPMLVASLDNEDSTTASLLQSDKPFLLRQVQQPQSHVTVVLFSSGTTGVPKGIPITDHTFYRILFGPKQKRSYLSLSPMYWYSGLVFNFSCIAAQQPVVMSNSLDVQDIMRLTDEYQIEIWFLSIRAVTQLVKSEQREKYNLSSLKTVWTGGEVLPGSVGKAFVERVIGDKVRFVLILGTTEAGGIAINSDVNLVDSKNKAVSCGKPLPGVEIKVKDEDGNLVAFGEEGEVWVKSNYLTSGYWNKPGLNSLALDQEGFMRSGDFGYVDLKGNLFNLGRIVDLITYKGTRVAVTAAEDILLAHSNVLEAAVVGTTDSQVGQLATAYVVKRAGSQVTERELSTLVDSQVDEGLKLRERVHIVDALPRLDVGKVLKKLLRQ